MLSKKYSVISLFAGCGGLDLGFVGGFSFLGKDYEKRNFDISWANDIDEAACQTFREYFKHDIICGDISKILNTKGVSKLFDRPLTTERLHETGTDSATTRLSS
jgi:site-specific DNA-cytosine methylase